jgi:hypothetical protein
MQCMFLNFPFILPCLPSQQKLTAVMIKAIDLRKGNWVNIEGKGYTRIEDTDDINRMVLQGAQPIPLTQALLQALGFTQRNQSEIFQIEANNFYYHLGVKRVAIFHPGNQLWHWLGTHIDHVHQIQNLFYCIVGHDLKLTL